MPGFDGTGPRGMGPMTGGRRGFCNPPGFGFAGRRFGISWGTPFYTNPYAFQAFTPGFMPFAPMQSQKYELNMLKQQAQILKEQLQEIETRINELAGV